eukprot:COSAG06_NODE_23929_length_677_cov_1.444637_1_plen_141_part_01
MSLASQLPLGVRICDELLFPDAMAALGRIQKDKPTRHQQIQQQQQQQRSAMNGGSGQHSAFYTSAPVAGAAAPAAPAPAPAPAVAAAPPPSRTLVAAASVVVGEKVTVLALAECKQAVLAAGMKFNPARQKRCSTTGVVLT